MLELETPPPPPPDINQVYRPDADAHVRHTIVAGSDEPEVRQATTFEEVLGLPPPAPAPSPVPTVPKITEEQAFEDVLGLRPQQQQQGLAEGTSLLDLWDMPPAPQPEAKASKEGYSGLLSDLPPGVDLSEKKKVVIDLSTPSTEDPKSPEKPPPKPSAAEVVGVSPGPKAKPIPTDAKGFGSQDLFGNGSQEKTIKDEAVEAAAAAGAAVYKMLPDQVKDKAQPFIPDCMVPTNEDEETEEVIVPSGRGTGALPPHTGAAAVRAQQMQQQQTALEQQHTQAAVDRACNGKWVPTYMRHQLAANGHTSLPTGANAHEHSASTEPPSLGEAFVGMGEDLGSSAAAMMTFVVAFLSSLSMQCQMCSHQAANNVHEQVISYGENLCYATQEEQHEERVMMGRPLSEAAAGLGPVRAQLRNTVQVSFATLMDIAKRRLVTPVAPPEFQRAIKARELARDIRASDVAVEDLLFHTEVRTDALPEAVLPHLCDLSAQPPRPLVCHETWHVESKEERAEAEISSQPTGAPVTVVLRVTVNGRSAQEGGGCDVESRLFVRPREHGAALPLGLVEQLTQVHQSYSQSLHAAVLALARESGSVVLPMTSVSQDVPAQSSEPLPVVNLTLPEKLPPSWVADAPAPSKLSTPPPRLEANTSGIDSSMLLQVADGI